MQGQREEESIDVLYNAHSLDKRETVAQIKLGRRLYSVLRFRAKCMRLPMNTDGYVPLALLLRHPAFGSYTVEDICDLVRTDSKQRYKIVKDEHANLHIRAQNGHGYTTPLRIKHAEVPPDDLPNEVSHCLLRVNRADILSRRIESRSRQYNHLIDRMSAPGECIIPGMRGECDVAILSTRSSLLHNQSNIFFQQSASTYIFVNI